MPTIAQYVGGVVICALAPKPKRRAFSGILQRVPMTRFYLNFEFEFDFRNNLVSGQSNDSERSEENIKIFLQKKINIFLSGSVPDGSQESPTPSRVAVPVARARLASPPL